MAQISLINFVKGDTTSADDTNTNFTNIRDVVNALGLDNIKRNCFKEEHLPSIIGWYDQAVHTTSASYTAEYPGWGSFDGWGVLNDMTLNNGAVGYTINANDIMMAQLNVEIYKFDETTVNINSAYIKAIIGLQYAFTPTGLPQELLHISNSERFVCTKVTTLDGINYSHQIVCHSVSTFHTRQFTQSGTLNYIRGVISIHSAGKPNVSVDVWRSNIWIVNLRR